MREWIRTGGFSIFMFASVCSEQVAADSDQWDVQPQMKELREFSRLLNQAIDDTSRRLEKALPQLEHDMRDIQGRLRQELPALQQRWEELLKKYKDRSRRWNKGTHDQNQIMV